MPRKVEKVLFVFLIIGNNSPPTAFRLIITDSSDSHEILDMPIWDLVVILFLKMRFLRVRDLANAA